MKRHQIISVTTEAFVPTLLEAPERKNNQSVSYHLFFSLLRYMKRITQF